MPEREGDAELTEREWLAGEDFEGMLRYLTGKVSERKFRLTECAFVRRFWHLLPDERNRRAIEVAERYADGLVSKAELTAAYAQAEEAYKEIRHAYFPDGTPQRSFWGGAVTAAQDTTMSMYDLPELFGKKRHALRPMINLVWIATAAYPLDGETSHEDGHKAIKAENLAQARLLHEIFGNPFRPVRLKRSWVDWQGGAVRRLARSIYDQCGFERMPQLGKLLAAAGCREAEILAHCRGGGTHVRGCWVVDLLLGRG